MHGRIRGDSHPTTQPGIAAGIYASQALGSIGAPSANLRHAGLADTTFPSSDALNPQGRAVLSMQQGGGKTTQPASIARSQPSSAASAESSFPQFETTESTRRERHLRREEEPSLHEQNHSQALAQERMYASSSSHSQGTTPVIDLQQATPQIPSQHTTPTVPSSLQPAGGSQQRPGPSLASNATPTTAPVVPQINTNAQQYTLPTRSNTMNQAQHGYSRSDSSGMDQRYIPFSAGSDKAPQYPPTPNQKMYNYSPQTPGGHVAQSPLVLEHIRPRTDSNLDDPASAHPWNDADKQPTNSNYLAPWPVFAYDWCKWPIVGHGNSSAGRMAVGSYLEDPHNFVSLPTKLPLDARLVYWL